MRSQGHFPVPHIGIIVSPDVELDKSPVSQPNSGSVHSAMTVALPHAPHDRHGHSIILPADVLSVKQSTKAGVECLRVGLTLRSGRNEQYVFPREILTFEQGIDMRDR